MGFRDYRVYDSGFRILGLKAEGLLCEVQLGSRVYRVLGVFDLRAQGLF